MKALLVGGESRYAFGTLAQNLKGMGITVHAHAGGRGKSQPLHGLRGCDVVIVLTDVCNRGISTEAKILAESAQIPYVSTVRKWATMKQNIGEMLQLVGVKALQDKNKGVQTQKKAANTAEQDRLDRRALDLANNAAKDALNLANKAVLKQVKTAVGIVLEERPEMVNDAETLTRRVRDLVSDAKNMDVTATVENTVTDIKARWKRGGRVGGISNENVADRQLVNRVRRTWALRFIGSHLAKHDELPSYQAIRTAMAAIFPKASGYETLKVYRSEAVLAFSKKRPVTEADIDDALAGADDSPDLNARSKESYRVNSSTLKKNQARISRYFKAAEGAGFEMLQAMDEAAGLKYGTSSKWRRKPPTRISEKNRTLVKAAIKKWKALVVDQAPLPFEVPVEVKKRREPAHSTVLQSILLKLGADNLKEAEEAIMAFKANTASVEGWSSWAKRVKTLLGCEEGSEVFDAIEDLKKEAQKPPVTVTQGKFAGKVAFLTPPNDRDRELFHAANNLRDLGIPIPQEIIRHFDGVVPKMIPELQRIKPVEFILDAKDFTDVEIPEGSKHVRLYRGK